MLFGPVKALYSINFYLNGLKKSGWRAFGFLAYLLAITAVLTGVYISAKAKPFVNQAIDKVAQYTPVINIVNGKATVNNDNPLKIEPPELEGYNIVFDTGKKDPVYPTEMTRAKTMLLLTKDTIYLNNNNGRFQQNQFPENINLQIDKELIESNRGAAVSLIIYIVIFALVLVEIFKLPFMILLAFIAALIMNSVTKANAGGVQLFKLACYLQGPSTIFFLLASVLPVKIPLIMFVYIVIYGIYAQIILSRFNPAPAADEGQQA